MYTSTINAPIIAGKAPNTIIDSIASFALFCLRLVLIYAEVTTEFCGKVPLPESKLFRVQQAFANIVTAARCK